MNMKNLKVTFSAQKYLAKEFKKPAWNRIPSGTAEWVEFHKNKEDVKLRALALNLTIVKIEELK